MNIAAIMIAKVLGYLDDDAFRTLVRDVFILCGNTEPGDPCAIQAAGKVIGVINVKIPVLGKVGVKGKSQQTLFIAAVFYLVGNIKKRGRR